MLETPILLLVFNRPRTTQAVLETIRLQRPTRFYIAGDGPRGDVKGEAQRCAEVRKIATAVDWRCEVETRFQDQNLGLGRHVSSAIDWFFEREAEGIILEDDCIPAVSFFPFCTELLRYYRDAAQVMHISGDNFQFGRQRGKASYYFSRYPFVWGWATWRRAWRLYDFAAASAEVQASTWDAQWLHALEKNGGKAICPNVNLVTNIGFGSESTHTRTVQKYSKLPTQEMAFPLRHPDKIETDRAADTVNYYVVFRYVRHLRLIWAYQLWDFLYRVLKTSKKRLFGVLQASRTRR